MLNSVISSPSVFWTPALVAAPYVSQNGSEECKGKENCHCTASTRLPCLLQSLLLSSDL
ncbi:rCG60169 [Rattus norvegicus]|uniref:RCG60169 n=1 Tax=Rattus norvegicus TaxID=10116 RepID=A6HR99_RAT|nr:rCG60169 [Rattus norvegicus]